MIHAVDVKTDFKTDFGTDFKVNMTCLIHTGMRADLTTSASGYMMNSEVNIKKFD